MLFRPTVEGPEKRGEPATREMTMMPCELCKRQPVDFNASSMVCSGAVYYVAGNVISVCDLPRDRARSVMRHMNPCRYNI